MKVPTQDAVASSSAYMLEPWDLANCTLRYGNIYFKWCSNPDGTTIKQERCAFGRKADGNRTLRIIRGYVGIHGHGSIFTGSALQRD